MGGYIFEYYKYVQYPRESMEDIRSCLAYEEARKSILTFGEYDRLKVNNISKIDRFRDLSALAKDWVGNRQSILLYDLDNTPRFLYSEDKDEWGFKESRSGQYDKHLFWALTELPFQNILREKMKDYGEFLQHAKAELEEMIQKESVRNTGDCQYMILGTFGIFGLSILWLCNQYTDILRIVNSIKRDSIYDGERVYFSAHTMFSRNPAYDQANDENELVKEIKGRAYVQVTLKKYINQSLDFFNQEKVKNIRHTSGEYDIAMEMESRAAFLDFEKWNIFNHDKDTYQRQILQTRVTLAEDIHCQSPLFVSDRIDESSSADKKRKLYDENLPNDLKDVKKVYENLRLLIDRKIDKTAGIIDTLDSLHCDYRYNVASAVNQSWADDFSYIFLKNMECIQEIISMENADIEFMPVLRLILNNLKQQVFHISEANSLNFELPKCHLRYTGREDCILFAYMGIIKEILKTAYQLKHCNKQTEIIPIVTVDIVPIIESELYFDKSLFVSKKETDQDFKIVSLNLPHVTFYDIPVYIQYLYHEIYHYIVPYDREERDYVMGIMLSAVYMQSVLLSAFSELAGSHKEMARKAVNYVQPLIYDIVIRNYSKMHSEITGFHECRKKSDTDTVVLIKRVYINELISCLGGRSTCIEDWIHELHAELCNGDFKGLCYEKLQVCLARGGAEYPFTEKLKECLGTAGGVKSFISGKEEYTYVIDKIADGLEEAAADVPMIELAQMPLEEYMLLYSQSLKHELRSPDVISFMDDLKELVRVGVILDIYEYHGCSLEAVRDIFIYRYAAKYFNYSGYGMAAVSDKINNRKRQAEEWFGYFLKCREEYKSEFGLYRKHCRILAEMSGVRQRLNGYNIEEKCNFYFYKYRKAYGKYAENIKKIEQLCQHAEEEQAVKLCQEASFKLHEETFAENIKLIHYFQKQEKLTDIHKINKQRNQAKADSSEPYRQPVFTMEFEGVEKVSRTYDSGRKINEVPTVYGLESFLGEMNSVTKMLEESMRHVFGVKTWPLWYRGQSDSSYGLLPGIMRSMCISNRKDFHYLSQYQRNLFGEFKFRADGAPEVMDKSFYGISDYLALMQHYGVNTNLMDWSEDAFTSLYFALEKLITHEERTAKKDAAIFVFSPHLYNEARTYMINESAKATACTELAFLASKKTADRSDGLIPNIAASYNENVYNMFLMGNIDYESENPYGYTREMSLIGKEEIAYLPLAVYTSRLNPRIRSQSGIFLAYNLYAEPSQNDNDAYAYMDLQSVQDYYFNVCGRKSRKEQFLYKIVIEKGAAEEIAECLYRMGISKERIYPELVNIGQRVR